MASKIVFLLTLLFISSSHGANILFMLLLPSPSHHIWNKAIINELASHGHNVTLFSPFSEENPPSNVHYITFEKGFETYLVDIVKEILNGKESINPFYEQILLVQSYESVCSDAVNTTGFQALLNYPDNFKFDLIVNDFTLGNCFLPFVHKFDYPPLLAVTAYGHPPFLNDLIGDHHYYAYVPHNILTLDDKMTFLQRFYNFMMYIEEVLLFEYYLTPRLDDISKKYFGSDVPSIREIEERTALAFVNTNPVMDYTAPLPENVIPVGGLHIKEPMPLSENLNAFIGSAKEGVVVLCFGTNFRSEYIPKAKQNLFLNVFRELSDYNFLWKFESDFTANDLPKNVRIEPWLPLSDILSNTKVKVVFFHGGLLTTQEALYRGVPMIIMPFGLDQQQNLVKTKQLGISEGIDFHSLSENVTKAQLLKVLEDPSYALNAKKWSARYRDQKEKPLDRPIWWIEWLLRNPNSDYLKSPVIRLGFIAGNAYDVIAAVIFIVILLTIIISKAICYCVGICTREKRNFEHQKAE